MPLPSAMVASIVAAVVETVAQGVSTADAARYDSYILQRALPPEVKVGWMQPPSGDGTVVIDDRTLPLSAVARFRNEQNLIVMSMTLREPVNVVYLNDNYGNVSRVWLISQAEADSLKQKD